MAGKVVIFKKLDEISKSKATRIAMSLTHKYIYLGFEDGSIFSLTS